jgi:hypothetical protein
MSSNCGDVVAGRYTYRIIRACRVASSSSSPPRDTGNFECRRFEMDGISFSLITLPPGRNLAATKQMQFARFFFC